VIATARQPMIEVKSVSKHFLLPHELRTTLREYFVHPLKRTTYEVNQALHDVTFDVERGEFFGIVGHNGSGKSTLLRILAGIYQPESGAYRVRGKVSPFIELGVGFNYDLSARDNVRINATLLGLSRRELAEHFDEIFEFAELRRFVDQKLKNFSNGMLVRLAFSIAIKAPFDILLLDEVLAVGDESFQEKCFAVFDQMRAERKTIVLVSHNLAAVAQFCDRVLLLERGVVRAIGAPDHVLPMYAHRQVAAS
jgi:ABC-type polysaccharide/polyol phosphate transport system ATPase subunit